MISIFRGLIYLLLGLNLFLAGVNSGFMDMGRLIGMELASMHSWVLISVAFVLGLIVVLVEPAVHVLGEQVQEVTSGAIPPRIIKATLSIGVGIAIALSMVRIVVPAVKLWYFLLPGFLIAIILSFRVKPIFVGIGFDAGGVASGPMSATFVLAFAQGAADIIPSANVLVDGFGVIAMIAMTPVLSIMVLGTVYSFKERRERPTPEQETLETEIVVDDIIEHDTIFVVVDRGFANKVVELARLHGATGTTILRGRGCDDHSLRMVSLLNIELQPEKEIVLFIIPSDQTAEISDAIIQNDELAHEADVNVFVSPVDIVDETFVSQ